MIRSALRDKVRIMGRITGSVASSVIDACLNEAAVMFARDTKVLHKNVAYAIAETFTLGTDEAFKLTIATAGSGYIVNGVDVVLGTAQSNVTGTALATALQAIIQASGVGASNTTVSYAAATRKFTITATAESSVASISIATPADPATYYECAYKLFEVLTSETQSAESFVGGASPYCQSERKLPTDFLAIDEIIYDNNYDSPLAPEIYWGRTPSLSGKPVAYNIRRKSDGEYIHISAHPGTKGTRVELEYVYKPATIATGSAGDATSYPFNASYDYALIHYAIYMLKLGEGRESAEDALMHKALYKGFVAEAEYDEYGQLGGGIDLTSRGRQDL